MFTGLIQATGAITEVHARDGGVRIRVQARGLAPRPIALGDSIAVNGVCLTVVTVHPDGFDADVSAESLSRTHGLDARRPVNLETSLGLGDKLGGHLVSGHVDGVGTIQVWRALGESTELVVRVPAALAAYVAVKGSITVDGVSLTVNRVDDLPRPDDPARAGDCDISINLIPHTVAATVFRHAAVGNRVNLEIDLVARYLARMAQRPPDAI